MSSYSSVRLCGSTKKYKKIINIKHKQILILLCISNLNESTEIKNKILYYNPKMSSNVCSIHAFLFKRKRKYIYCNSSF